MDVPFSIQDVSLIFWGISELAFRVYMAATRLDIVEPRPPILSRTAEESWCSTGMISPTLGQLNILKSVISAYKYIIYTVYIYMVYNILIYVYTIYVIYIYP